MPLESEGAFEPNITENYDNLSIDELRTKLESEEGIVAKLTKDIATSNEELKKKEEEAKVPLQEYEDAKKEWERLDGIYQEKRKDLDEIEREVKYANGNFTIAENAFNDINNIVTAQDAVEKTYNERKKILDDINANPTLLLNARTRLGKLTTEISTLETSVNNLMAPRNTAERNRDSAQKIFNGYQGKFNDKQCENSANPECPYIIKNRNVASETLQRALESFKKADDQYTVANNQLTQLKADKITLEAKISGYIDIENDINFYITQNQVLFDLTKKKMEALKPPRAEALGMKRNAEEALTKANERKTKADQRKLEYETNEAKGVNDAILAESMAFATFKEKETVRDPLYEELEKRRKHKKKLEKELEEANLRVGALRKKRDEAKVGIKTGFVFLRSPLIIYMCFILITYAEKNIYRGAGLPTWVIYVISAVIIIFVCVVGVFLYIKRKRGKKGAQEKAGKTSLFRPGN